MTDAETSKISTFPSPQERAVTDRARLSALLVLTGEGDARAFEEIYRRTSAKLFGACLRIFAERSEAEDALQDAYITIWNKAGSFDGARGSPITWLMTVTRNRAIDRLRSARKLRLAPIVAAEEISDPAPRADERMIEEALDGALANCIQTLEVRDANFIRASFLNGLTYADLAAREGSPLGTVKSRIRRALIKLRDCLGGNDGNTFG